MGDSLAHGGGGDRGGREVMTSSPPFFLSIEKGFVTLEGFIFEKISIKR